jgi:hypothetical protein
MTLIRRSWSRTPPGVREISSHAHYVRDERTFRRRRGAPHTNLYGGANTASNTAVPQLCGWESFVGQRRRECRRKPQPPIPRTLRAVARTDVYGGLFHLLQARPGGRLAQREEIVIKDKTILHSVPGQRIRASSLCKGALFHAPTVNDSRQTIISLDAARLVKNSVFCVALPGELLLGGPRPRPHGRIFSGHHVFQRRWFGPCPTFDQVQVLARSLIIGFRTEVGHIDHEGIALPVAA